MKRLLTIARTRFHIKASHSIMCRSLQVFAVVGLSLSITCTDVLARGGGGGGRGGGGGGARAGGGGGGGARMSAPSRAPSVSRPSMPSNMGSSRPASRPAQPSASRPTQPSVSRPSPGQRPSSPGGTARPGGGADAVGAARPGTGAVGGARPGVGSGVGSGTRPGTGAIGAGGANSRPSSGQLNDFLDIKPSTGAVGGRNGALGAVAGGVAGGIAGGAASEFLRDSGARPSQLPADGGVGGAGGVGRPGGVGDAGRPGGVGGAGGVGRPGGVGDAGRPGGVGGASGLPRPGTADRPLASNRPERVQNRDQMHDNRTQRRDEILDEINDTPIRDFWQDNPGWAAWRLTAPYRWATWGAMSGWVGNGWTESYPYSYGENVYYQEGSVYYDEQPVATAEEYATQAQAIVESAPEVAPEQAEWLPLGVYALTQDGQASGSKPSLFLQLAISKEGVIGGTLRNDTSDTTQQIEGMADKSSQRVAWTVVGQSRPIMETGIANLTEDTCPVLVHFADGETQQWLLVHLKDPQAQTSK